MHFYLGMIIDQAKSKNGNIFKTMKETRKKFKQGLKLCKKNEIQIKREKIINLYSVCDNKSMFWKEIKNLKKINHCNSQWY